MPYVLSLAGNYSSLIAIFSGTVPREAVALHAGGPFWEGIEDKAEAAWMRQPLGRCMPKLWLGGRQFISDGQR